MPFPQGVHITYSVIIKSYEVTKVTIIGCKSILINISEVRIEVSESKQRNLKQNVTVWQAALIINELGLQDLNIGR